MSHPSIDVGSPPALRRSIPLNGITVLLALIAALALLPLIASPYVLLLMLPFVGYGIALLGFNLLFGTTGLLSFGHALFLGLGAYTAAVLTSKLAILSFEIILVVSAMLSALVSLLIGTLCVRYTLSLIHI